MGYIFGACFCLQTPCAKGACSAARALIEREEGIGVEERRAVVKKGRLKEAGKRGMEGEGEEEQEAAEQTRCEERKGAQLGRGGGKV